MAQIFANALIRKRSDLVLSEREERLSLATAAAGVGVWMWDVSRNEVWATEMWRRMFGFSTDAVIRYETVIERIHPRDREAVERAVRRAMEDQADYSAEYRLVLPDGTQRWIGGRGRMRLSPGMEQARMLGVSVDISERKQAEQSLEERLRFEQLLTELSTMFINQAPDQIDAVISQSLKRLVETLGHDRSSLAQISEENGPALVTHSYTVPGVEPLPVGISVEDLVPWYAGEIRKGHMLLLRNLPDDFPSEATKERQVCITQGIESSVAIPLQVGSSVVGIISFSFLKQHCDWPPEVVPRLRIIGEIYANALVRKRSDEAIRAALLENKQLQERLERENVYLREQITLKHQHGRIIGKSRALRRVLSDAESVAKTDAPVLLLGETGTGKELLAQAIHETSARKDRPMVVVNCASLPATLIESELFGREAGGLHRRRLRAGRPLHDRRRVYVVPR